jgi:hypothetical protein
MDGQAAERLSNRKTSYIGQFGLAALAWHCGQFASPPILRAFDYQGRSLMVWVIVSGLLFGSFWFSFHGGAFSVVKRVLL